MKHFFITGTDTNVGKTLTAAIITQLINGYYWKPIQSGIQDDIRDSEQVAKLIGLAKEKIIPSNYELGPSLSPHHAAEIEGIHIDIAKINKPSLEDNLVVEGAGGVFVPVNNKDSMLDIMVKLALPVIVVTRGTLGTINHTLLTLQALRQRNLSIYGIVFNGELNPANQKTIEQWGKVKTLFHIPNFPTLNKLTLNQWLEKQNLRTVFS